jgi:ATP-dependent Clp protease ATP-binding subunit ClpB
VYGARPLRRYIQREVETRIARSLIAGDIPDGASITLEADGDQPAVRWDAPANREETTELAGTVA